ncbi:serine/threonine protein kinase [Colwellia psychrerythraea]|uniref:Serine/threonine protein kinase n=1 Tax=Colwellia psychrerythraea TaxID=28229 RepID=A0A099KVL9_COLPS|nr:serine/threonine-protein kinase [Colwellia psychrerythraea]KGJ94794.1 serine/threonine protein kinase [Colwellia psychrerythraea]
MSESQNKDNKNEAALTVFKPRTPKKANVEPAVVTDQRTVIKVKAPQHELTRIRQSIRVQDNSIGFAAAKLEADDALQQQKIVLNNRFVLESTLGAGGMGTVYKAQDLRKVEASDIKTAVAVKVLNDEFKNHPDAFVSLQREASRSHILSHPNIVTVHDFDRDGDVIFMTMELLSGRPLDSLLRDYSGTGMSLDKAIPIIEDYCSALSFAHQKHFIHSDLKPGNIFVTDEGTKVLDFGIARISNVAAVKDHFDAGDLGALTPAYASLEMLNGGDPHPSDDVYAAALIAYELFSGKHPFNRLPANEVRDKKLKPKRIKELNKRQWQALEAALVVDRDKRTQSIEDFWNAFANKKRLPIYRVISAILLIVTVWFVYNTFIAQSEMSKLADSTFIKASDCLANKKANCAMEGAKAVLKLTPDYPEAQLLLQQAKALKLAQTLTELFNDVHQCIYNNNDTVCAEKALYSMQNLASNADQTLNAEDELSNFKERTAIANALKNAEQCLQEKSYLCVLENTNTILDLRPDHIQATSLSQQANQQISQLEKKRIVTQQQYDNLIIKANNCFNNKDYACAKKSADSALVLNSTDEVRAIQRDAEMALIEVKRNLLEKKRNRARADNMVVQARQCLAKKQYDCAIAKSESALNLVPKYPSALNTLKQATEERQKLKTSFSLQ